ncbi:MAG: integrase family protein [Burkholderiaceae bacterium]|jgi:integrase|nr:integrase family protein [Burkholderiaceae bacterium]
MRTKLTAGRVAGFTCDVTKAQAFLWDSEAKGLGLRVTRNGARAYVFQARLRSGDAVRMTIGTPQAWSIDAARERARELQRIIDVGRDPREVQAEAAAADAAARAEREAHTLTVADAWAVYMREGKPKRKDAWKPRYVADLHAAASPGGKPKARGEGTTKPGHLWPLMGRPLRDITQDVVRDWYREESERGKQQAARAVAMLSGFLSWCGTRREYRELVDTHAARASELRDVLPAARRRTDALEPDQVRAWWAGTEKLAARNRTAALYLRALLLTGARREEMAALKWADVDFRWRRVTIADKIDATRTVPLTPYLSWMLSTLPRLRRDDGTLVPYVFGNLRSKTERIAEPRGPHEDVLADAGLPHVSIHGLRRSFALLGEAAGAPAGAIAQIMGHRPSGVHEGYKPRSVDQLREHLTRVEAFVLARAGVEFDADKARPGALEVVHG